VPRQRRRSRFRLHSGVKPARQVCALLGVDGFGEDESAVVGPGEAFAPVVLGAEGDLVGGDEVRDAGEGAGADHLAGDDLEEVLDEVQSGGFPTSASRRCSPEPSPSEARSEARRLKVLARSATRLSSLPARVGRCGLSGAEASASR
jgi:hypothetical protein